MKREVRHNKETQNSLFQVLYSGRKGGKDKEVFFFYKEPQESGDVKLKNLQSDRQMMLGILNLKEANQP